MPLATSTVFSPGFKWVRTDKKAYLQVISTKSGLSDSLLNENNTYQALLQCQLECQAQVILEPTVFQMLQQIEQFLTVFAFVRATDTHRFYSVQRQMISLINGGQLGGEEVNI